MSFDGAETRGRAALASARDSRESPSFGHAAGEELGGIEWGQQALS